jgi:hypothetical protein
MQRAGDFRAIRPSPSVKEPAPSAVVTEETGIKGHPEMAAGSLCLAVEAVEACMLSISKFKTAVGGATLNRDNYNPALNSVREAFKESAVGCNYPKRYSAFEDYLRRKYNAAIAFHCSSVFQHKITDINWLTGSAKAQAIDRCLEIYPGTVHIWVTSEDTQALFFPHDEDSKLPYLYPPLPVNEGSKITTHVSEPSQPSANSTSCPSMSVSAATDHLPVSIQ